MTVLPNPIENSRRKRPHHLHGTSLLADFLNVINSNSQVLIRLLCLISLILVILGIKVEQLRDVLTALYWAKASP